MTIAMTAMSVSGAFEDIANGISSVLQDCGVPKLTADIIAKVFVLVIVIAVTFYCAPGSAAGEAADTGTEIAEDASDTAIEMDELGSDGSTVTSSSTTAATDTASATSKLGKVLKAVKAVLKNVRGNLIVSNSLQTLSQLNLNEVIDQIPMSNDERKKVELGLEITLMVLTLISSITTAYAMSGGVASGTSPLSRLLSRSTSVASLGRFIASGFSKVGSGTMMSAAELSRQAMMLVASGLQIAEGAILIKQASLTKDLAHATANSEMVKVNMNMTDAMALNTIKHDTAVQQQHVEQDKHFQQNFAAGEKAFAQLFTTHSPV